MGHNINDPKIQAALAAWDRRFAEAVAKAAAEYRSR
jgi:hypothetical protein